MSSPWFELLDEPARAALKPTALELPDAAEVVVIGGGVAGLAAAAMCRRAGIDDVVVLERGERLAGETSNGPAGLLNPDMQSHRLSPRFAEIARQSTALHLELDREWGGEIGYYPVELLVCGEEARGVEGDPHLTEHLDGLGVAALDPQVALTEPGVLLRRQWGLNPLRLCAALAAHGGPAFTGTVVMDWDEAGGRIVRLATPRGAISPGTVIFATASVPGRWMGVSQDLVKGTTVVTDPAPFRLNVAVIESILVRQLPDGRLLAGSTLEADLEPEALPQRVAEIRADLARLVPAAAALPTRWAWCCFRPGTPDRLPVVDRLPGLDNAFVSAGHYRTGILAGPGLAAALATWIASGRRPPELLPLALDRFAELAPAVSNVLEEG